MTYLQTGDPTLDATLAELRKEVAVIMEEAEKRGFIVDLKHVCRHLSWWRLWYAGKLKSGHLVGRTGVKYTTPYPPPRWDASEK